MFLQVTANLVPLNARRVAVKFDFFRIAGLVSDILLVLKNLIFLKQSYSQLSRYRPAIINQDTEIWH